MGLKLSTRDKFILVCAIVGAIVSSYLLLAPESVLRSGNGALFGSLENSIQDIRLKPFDQMRWYHDIALDTELFENDKIFSGQNSFADIRATSGEILRLQPESLVVLTRDQGELVFELQQGTAEIFDEESKPVRTIQAPASFSVPPEKQSKFKIRRQARVLTETKVIPAPLAESLPPATIPDATQAVTQSSADEGEIAATPVVEEPTIPTELPEKIVETPVQLESKISKVISLPATRKAIEKGDSHRVVVSLNKVSPEEIVEISVDNDFAKILSTATAKRRITFKGLKAGKYFVRVQQKERTPASELAPSEAFSVEVKDYAKLADIRPSFPTDGQVFIVRSEKSKIPLRVKKSPDVTEYEFEVSSDTNFRTPQYRLRSPSSQTQLTQKLENGPWFLRVRGWSEKSSTDWSAPIEFRVQNQ